MASNVVETILGAAVLCVAGGFLYHATQASDLSAGGSSYELKAQFFNADGISKGGEVRMSGVKIGTVRAVELDKATFQANVLLALNTDVQVPSDSSAKVASDGLLGGAYLALSPGGSEYYLEPGESIEYTQGSVSLVDLIGKAIHAGVGGD